MKQYAFVIELDRCIGCKGCQVACKMENGTDLGSDRTKVRQIGPIGKYPNLQMYFLPTMCQQCENPVCAHGAFLGTGGRVAVVARRGVEVQVHVGIRPRGVGAHLAQHRAHVQAVLVLAGHLTAFAADTSV